MGYLFGKFAPLVVILLFVFLVAQPIVRVIATANETVGQFAARVPMNFYARAVTRGKANPAYEQKSPNFCILYASAFATRTDPMILRAALERVRPGATQSEMGDVVGIMSAFGWNLQSENFLLDEKREQWMPDQLYTAWLQKTRQWVNGHLPAMVYPRVPNILGAPYHSVIILRWSGGVVRFFDPGTAELLDVPEESMARAIIGDDIENGGWLSHYVWQFAGTKK